MEDVVQFEIAGEAHPGLLPRIAGLVAQLGLVPAGLWLRRGANDMTLTLLQDNIDPHRAAIVAEKMRSIVSVDTVEMTCHSCIDKETT